MAQKKTEEKPKAFLIILVLALIAVLGAFGAGYMLKDVLAPQEEGTEKAEVVLKDGSALSDKLESMQKSMAEQNAKALAELEKELKGFSLDRRVMDITAGLPVNIFDTSDIEDLPSKGPEDALLTVVEFSDFQCPYCGRMAIYLEDVIKKHPGKIRLIFVDRPLLSLHPYAHYAHQAAHEAREQGKFWEMYEYLFKNARGLLPRNKPNNNEEHQENIQKAIDNLVEAAGELGLDQQSMRQALEDQTHLATVERHNKLAVSLGINSTPTLFVNSYFQLKDPGALTHFIEESVELE